MEIPAGLQRGAARRDPLFGFAAGRLRGGNVVAGGTFREVPGRVPTAGCRAARKNAPREALARIAQCDVPEQSPRPFI